MRGRTVSIGRRSLASLTALLVVTSVLGPVGTVSAQTVSVAQAANATTVAPGGTLTVEARIDYSDVNEPALDVALPADWTVGNHTDDGGQYTAPASWTWNESDADGVNGTHTVSYTIGVPENASEGNYSFVATASGAAPGDNSTVTDRDEVTVTVEEPNEPPAAEAGADQTVVEGDQVTLDATNSSDPDGSVEGYNWTQTAGPAVDLSDPGAAQPTVTAPNVSEETALTFVVEVTDDDGATASDSTTVTVAPPIQAAINRTPSAPEVGESVAFDGGPSRSSNGTIEDYAWRLTGDGVGTTLLLDSDFEAGSLADAGWTHVPVNASADGGVMINQSNSGIHAAYNSWGAAALVSPTMNASGLESVTVSYWVREGAEPYAENPNPGEDLSVQYRAENGTWVEVERIRTDGGGGNVLDGTVTVTADAALHDAFQVRFYQVDADYIDTWLIDDVTVTGETGATAVTAAGETMAHEFGTAGNYSLELTVTDDRNRTATTTATVRVTEPTYPPLSLEAGVASLDDSGDDVYVELREVQLAFTLADAGRPVPGTDSATLSASDLQALVDLWRTGGPALTATGGGS